VRLVLALAIAPWALAACAPDAAVQRSVFEARGPQAARRLRGTVADFQYVGDYLAALTSICPNDEVIAYRDDSYDGVELASDPPQFDSRWVLSGCGNRLDMKVNCTVLRKFNRSDECRWEGGESLSVVHSAAATALGEQLRAAAHQAAHVLCTQPGSPRVRAGFVAHLIPTGLGAMVRRLRIDHCGVTYDVAEACNVVGESVACSATVVPIAPSGQPGPTAPP
jgi:hypothetical protein